MGAFSTCIDYENETRKLGQRKDHCSSLPYVLPHHRVLLRSLVRPGSALSTGAIFPSMHGMSSLAILSLLVALLVVIELSLYQSRMCQCTNTSSVTQVATPMFSG